MDDHDHKSLKRCVKELQQSEYNCFRQKVLYQELQQIVLQKQAGKKTTEPSGHNGLTKTIPSTSTSSTKIPTSKSTPSKKRSSTNMKRSSDFQGSGDFRTVFNRIQTYHSHANMIDNLEKEVPARTNFLKSIE